MGRCIECSFNIQPQDDKCKVLTFQGDNRPQGEQLSESAAAACATKRGWGEGGHCGGRHAVWARAPARRNRRAPPRPGPQFQSAGAGGRQGRRRRPRQGRLPGAPDPLPGVGVPCAAPAEVRVCGGGLGGEDVGAAHTPR